MDLKTTNDLATADEVDAIESVLGPAIDGWHTGVRSSSDHHMSVGGQQLRDRRHELLGVLHAVNDRVGWISPGAINEISARTEVAPAEVFAVASFYALFSLKPCSPRQVHVCVDAACRAAGSTDSSIPAGAHASPCLGACERAPVGLVIEAGTAPRHAVIEQADAATVQAIIDGAWPTPEAAVAAALPQPAADRLLLGRIGVVDPLSIDSYRAHDGYLALRRAFELGPVGVIREVTADQLCWAGHGICGVPARSQTPGRCSEKGSKRVALW